MRPNENGKNMRTVWSINTKPFKEAHFAVFPEKLASRMIKSGCPENGLVLDPFMGAGTTAVTAISLNRNFVGFELNSDYCRLIEKSSFGHARSFFTIAGNTDINLLLLQK